MDTEQRKGADPIDTAELRRLLEEKQGVQELFAALDALDSTRKALAESEAAGAVLAKLGRAALDWVSENDGSTDRLDELDEAFANLPASVRRHVAEHEALRELASFIPHECMWPAKRCAGCDGIKAARAKLDAARRGEG